MSTPQVSTFLWLEGRAFEAARFYTSVFQGAKIVNRVSSDADGGFEEKQYAGVTIDLFGQRLTLFNGGSYYKLSAATSIMVTFDTQGEIDHAWNALLADGGAAMQCGWLTDKFGLSWQILPKILSDLLQDKDRTMAARAQSAMMKMVKLDMAELQRAFDGR